MSDYIFYNDIYIPEPFGLNNTGSICWLNSLLQVLLSCPSLNETVIACADDFGENPFAMEYLRLVKSLVPVSPDDEPLDQSRIAVASSNILRGFVEKLKSSGSELQIGNSQECVDEAFCLFIDMFENQKISKLFSNIYMYTIKCTNCKNEISAVRQREYKINLFCRKKLATQKEFCSYLIVHTSEVDKFYCDKCRFVSTNFQRIERLRAIREIIVITFNKYHQKDNRWFPGELIIPSLGGKVLRYKLVGQIENNGTMFGGHYYCNALREGKFIRFNDSSYMDIDGQPTALTYMVFYHLVAVE